MTCDLSSAYIVEPPDEAPPRRQASSLIENSWSSVSLAGLKPSKTMIMVISLLMLAGGTAVVGILFEQHAAGAGIDQDGVQGPGDKGIRALGRCRRHQTGNQQPAKQSDP